MGSLTAFFGGSPRVAVLEAFAENPDDALSVPEIVAESEVSRRGAYIHVRKLLEEGILKRSHKQGKCWYYRLSENDKRAAVLPFLDSIVTLGRLESEIREDQGIAPDSEIRPVLELDVWPRASELTASPRPEVFIIGREHTLGAYTIGETTEGTFVLSTADAQLTTVVLNSIAASPVSPERDLVGRGPRAAPSRNLAAA